MGIFKGCCFEQQWDSCQQSQLLLAEKHHITWRKFQRIIFGRDIMWHKLLQMRFSIRKAPWDTQPFEDDLLSGEPSEDESLSEVPIAEPPIANKPLSTWSPNIKAFLLLLNTLETSLDHNFFSCVLVMGAGVMSFHYQEIVKVFRFCPQVMATGPVSTGQSVSIQAALSLFGAEKSLYEIQQGILLTSGSNFQFTIRNWWSQLSCWIKWSCHFILQWSNICKCDVWKYTPIDVPYIQQ